MSPRRSLAPLLAEQTSALLRSPLLHHLGAAVPGNDVGRPRQHPAAAHLAFGALARLWRSGARVDGELRSFWPTFVELFNAGAADAATDPVPSRAAPLTWHHYRRARDRMSADPVFEALRGTFTAQSLTLARSLGLLNPDGPGSLTHPDPSRTVFGDGTVVRPLYKSVGELDPAEAAGARPGRRRDPDAEVHVRHDGSIIGTNFVSICARTPDRWGRVILAVGHVPAPGQEAATAVGLVRGVHAQAGAGIQAVVYEGAFSGTHIEQLMTRCGVLVVNKVAAAPTTPEQKAAAITLPKQMPVGVYTHQPGGPRCRHTVIAQGGALVEVDHDDNGRLVVTNPLRRTQVKRAARPGGGYRFTLGAEIPCPHGAFTIWVSPHPERGDTTYRRPENIRLLPQGDPDFDALYGLRNDSESLNRAFKATLLVDRAMSLGWRRQLFDLLCYATLSNTLAWHKAELRRPLRVAVSAA